MYDFNCCETFRFCLHSICYRCLWADWCLFVCLRRLAIIQWVVSAYQWKLNEIAPHLFDYYIHCFDLIALHLKGARLNDNAFATLKCTGLRTLRNDVVQLRLLFPCFRWRKIQSTPSLIWFVRRAQTPTNCWIEWTTMYIQLLLWNSKKSATTYKWWNFARWHLRKRMSKKGKIHFLPCEISFLAWWKLLRIEQIFPNSYFQPKMCSIRSPTENVPDLEHFKFVVSKLMYKSLPFNKIKSEAIVRVHINDIFLHFVDYSSDEMYVMCMVIWAIATRNHRSLCQ